MVERPEDWRDSPRQFLADAARGAGIVALVLVLGTLGIIGRAWLWGW